MQARTYAHLLAIARRWSRRPEEADDLVQDALLEGVRTGRVDDAKWLAGVIRNRARLAARSAVRRKARDADWQALRVGPSGPAHPPDITTTLTTLPPALKALAALALSGHNRREIAYLLALTDPALRQRVIALKRHLRARGIDMPQGTPGLTLDLAYGRIRDALLPVLLAQRGIFASHDPDGHIFIVRAHKTASGGNQAMSKPIRETLS